MATDKKMYNLTHHQKGMWYTEKIYPDTAVGVVSGTFRMKENINYDVLSKAINAFVRDNDAMRIRIVEDKGEARQYIADYEPFAVDFADFSGKEKNELYNWEREQTIKPMDLIDCPLFSFIMIKVSDNDGGYLIKTHHIISDAWSMILLTKQVLKYYKAFINDEDMIKEGISYIKHISDEEEYLNSQRYIKDKEYWKEKMENFDEITTLTLGNLGKRNTIAKRKTFVIPEKLLNKINEFTSTNKTTKFTLFVAALSMYINRVTGRDDLLFGTSLLNRINSEEKKMLGLFASTAIPLSINLMPSINFKEFIENISKETISALRHQKYPYEEILNEIKKKNKSASQIFDIVLNYQNAQKDESVEKTEYVTRWHFNECQIESLIINVNDRDNDSKLIIDYDFLENAFNVKSIEFLHEHIINILWHALDDPNKEISKLEMLSGQEKEKILCEFNDTKADYDKEITLDRIFENQVLKTPQNIAVISGNETITYEKLNIKANKLANLLRKNGVKEDDVVGLMINRSIEMIIAVIAIHKAGAAYMPIAVDYPSDRKSFMMKNSNAKVLLYGVIDGIEEIDAKKIKVDINDIDNESEIAPEKLHNSHNLAYVIYTSGSTGNPKGVMIEHRSAVNRVNWMQKKYPLDSTDVILQKTPYTFDVSVWELVWWYFVGAKVCMLEPEAQKYPDKIIEEINRSGITTMHFVPSMLNAFLGYMEVADAAYKIKTLRRVFASGEALTLEQVNKYNRLIYPNSNAILSNLYGPTEAAVDVSYFDCNPENVQKIIPIGKPIDNIQLYVLDKNLNILPIGIAGELYIAGDGVGRGYINNPTLTAEKFVNNPFDNNKSKMYKTGDLARFMPRGDIEYLGRIDFQVKIRGFRIEMGEIESQILKFPGINESVVIVVQNEGNGLKDLCVYFTADEEIDIKKIKEALKLKLPEYMVPAYYMQLTEMPLSHNGKLDRKKLPKIIQEEEKVVLPKNKTEEKIVNVIKEVLEIPELSIDKNIFEMGADSLKIIQIVTRLYKNNWNINIQDFYENPTVEKISEKIEQISIDKGQTLISQIENVPDFDENIQVIKSSIISKNILLTGGTGFLGAHLIKEIIEKSQSSIYCIVRAKEGKEAEKRLKDIIKFYFNEDYFDYFGKRIFAICGDLTLPMFGLNEIDYEKLGIKINNIIHSAANVKYYGNYDEIEKVNVNGTQNIIDFAQKYNIRMNHISTITVAGEYLVKNKGLNCEFTEKDLFVGQDYMDNIYVRSKLEAENKVLKAIKDGLNATIYRLGNLTGRYSDGCFQKNINENAFYSTLKLILRKPEIVEKVADKMIEFTPIDYVADSIIKTFDLNESSGRVFHIVNNNLISLKDVTKLIKMVNMDYKKGLTEEEVLASKSYVNENGDIIFDSDMIIKNEISNKFLSQIDFIWPCVDYKYIEKIITYMKKVKFI